MGGLGNDGKNGTSFPGLLIAVIQTGFGHSFAKAALFDEFLFQRFQLLIQQIIRLMNQADRDVCNHLCRTGVDELSIHFECLRCPPSFRTTRYCNAVSAGISAGSVP